MASPHSSYPTGPVKRNSDEKADQRTPEVHGAYGEHGAYGAGGAQPATHPTPGDAGPRFGVGRESDPGFVRSLSGGTLIGQLRRAMLALTVAPVLILAIVPFIVREGRGRLGEVPAWVYVPIVLAALLAAVAGPRVPRPVAAGRRPQETAGAAVLGLRQAIFLRFALCEAVIIMGLPLSIISRSEAPFLAGFVLGYPLLIWSALPTTGLVERVRRRLEADGAESHLWAALLSHYSPPRA